MSIPEFWRPRRISRNSRPRVPKFEHSRNSRPRVPNFDISEGELGNDHDWLTDDFDDQAADDKELYSPGETPVGEGWGNQQMCMDAMRQIARIGRLEDRLNAIAVWDWTKQVRQKRKRSSKKLRPSSKKSSKKGKNSVKKRKLTPRKKKR